MESENTPQFRNVKTHISDQSFCLPVEILEEILSRLPVKSLLKFRCVSKSWRSLVGSKRFIKKHLDNSTKNASFAHHGIILNSLRPHRGLKQCSLRSMLDDPFTNQFRFCDSLNIGAGSICVVGCCNGLVCILHEGKHFMLWNPSTRMTKKLPAIDHKIKHGHITSYGFGFDYLSCDYKVFGVLSVFWVTAGYEAISKVYSLGTNSWKLVKNGDASLSPFSEQGKFASGKLHWHRNVGLGSDIASFDLRSEAYGVVELPWYGDGFVESMEVMGGCLSMLCDYPSQFDIWIMKEYGVRESWKKVVTVPLPQLDNPLEYSYTFLLALGPNGEVLLTHGSTFVIYYPEGNGYRHFQVKNIAPFRYANVYVESLVPLIPCGEQVACSPERVE